MLQASHLRPGTLFADKYLIGKQRRRSSATFTVAAEVRNDPYGDEGMEVWHKYRAAGCGKHRLPDYSTSHAGTNNVAFVCQQLSSEHRQGSLNAAAGRLCTPEDDLMKAAAQRFCAPAVPTKQDTRSCCNASQWCTSRGLQSQRRSVQILAWQTRGLNSRCCCRCPLGSSLTKRHSKQSRTSITLQLPCPQQSGVCCHRYVTGSIHVQLDCIKACQVLDEAPGPLSVIDLAIVEAIASEGPGLLLRWLFHAPAAALAMGHAATEHVCAGLQQCFMHGSRRLQAPSSWLLCCCAGTCIRHACSSHGCLSRCHLRFPCDCRSARSSLPPA